MHRFLHLGVILSAHSSDSLAAQINMIASITEERSRLLGDDKQARALGGGYESAKVPWHCSPIVGYKDPAFKSRESQHARVLKAPQARIFRRLEVD